MIIPGRFIAIVPDRSVRSGLAFPAERDRQINICMKMMFREGYRRFRTVPVQRTGNEHKWLVMGWPTSSADQCANCQCMTGGENAWIGGRIWCHPCADKWDSVIECVSLARNKKRRVPDQ